MSYSKFSLESILQDTLAALARFEGSLWKEAKGEIHSQNDEIPIWILLYEDSDLVKAHDALLEVIKPALQQIRQTEQPQAQASVWYTIIKDNALSKLEHKRREQELAEQVKKLAVIEGIESVGASIQSKQNTYVFQSIDSRRP